MEEKESREKNNSIGCIIVLLVIFIFYFIGKCSRNDTIDISKNGILKIMVRSTGFEPFYLYLKIENFHITQIKTVENSTETIDNNIISSEVRQDESNIYIKYVTKFEFDGSLLAMINNIKLDRNKVGEWQDSASCSFVTAYPDNKTYWDMKIISYENLDE